MRRAGAIATFAAIAACGLVGGLVTRQLLNGHDASPPATATALTLPMRGGGDLLVEFYDPSCASSRALHRDIDELFRTGKAHFRHLVLPVGLRAAGIDVATSICSQSSADAWRVATEYADDARWRDQAPARVPIDDQKTLDCRTLVDVLTALTSALADGSASAPVIVYRGAAYRGRDALRAALGDVP